MHTMVKMFRTLIMTRKFFALYIIIFHEIHRYHEKIVVYDLEVNMLQYVTRCSEAFRINLARAEAGERIRILRSDCGKQKTGKFLAVKIL